MARTMIERSFLTTFFLVQSCSVFAQASADPPTPSERRQTEIKQDSKDYAVSSYKIGKIAKIVATRPSIKSDYDPKENCSDFKMTSVISKFLFKHSVAVSTNAFWHDYIYTSCHAAGKVKFANGDEGTWTIYRYGRGTIEIINGKSKGEFIHLFCQQCEDQDG